LSGIQHECGESNKGKSFSVLVTLERFAMVLRSTIGDGANLGSIMRTFMKEFCSPNKTQSLCNKISTFSQFPTERVVEVYEHFYEYTRVVPHHKFPKEDLVQMFYQGLNMASRTITSVGGSIIELTPTDAFTLFKKVADNDT
jgi:hypothetical protein